MAIATAPRGRSNAALTVIRRAFGAIVAALTATFEIYREAVAERDAYHARNPHLGKD
ncbi:MAG: hypothetical protein HLUCCO17_04250 [Saliniramus fredricksonii]|uniref:Uncharacterized protein n=1 Tax=Saliniramus fredricksonii TaxID=1653334 RepID=A0A0P7X9W8_9HYPH|nr:hypothetical protein [Saliniramus fredricksonii]KPQ12016.1 MAG: hypothetical protein HLUCCO17_04250 [Saliniramus fredricksonii]SCC81489.1 hypothetical protein GA0071312_2433 [Saliniramus fredricksonii]